MRYDKNKQLTQTKINKSQLLKIRIIHFNQY
jgi:hypothetical protein